MFFLKLFRVNFFLLLFMLKKKIRRKRSKAPKNIHDQNSKSDNNEEDQIVKWLAFYEKYPNNFLMSRKDADTILSRLHYNKNQGILKAEKNAFINFVEFIKKSDNPNRIEPYKDIYFSLKKNKIKIATKKINDISIEEDINFRDDSFLDIENEREKILLETKRDKAGNKRIEKLLEKTNDIDTKKNEMNEPSNKSIKVREILNTSNTGKSSAIIYDEKKNNNTDKKTNIESDKKIEVNNNNTSEGSIFNKNKVKRIHLGKKEINSKEKFEKETKNDNIKIIGNNEGQIEADNDPPSNVMNSNEQNQLF